MSLKLFKENNVLVDYDVLLNEGFMEIFGLCWYILKMFYVF